ncbi:MAG: N-acetylmuramoyl-L-alanine amidase [Firmicutes bacterium]|nr:N-acetylmuramoyl-L-alanine amidase [Bacillota bacterium]MBQ9604521.1 N-acetylmuramoyl-L-alanine amidase [Bacillota bacterium]
MQKTNLVTYLYIALIFIGTAHVYYSRTSPAAALPVNKKHIVLDAGHGGFDPGKVAENGIEEKAINLEIMKLLQGYLEQGGAVVSITRAEDEALGDRKNADLKNRMLIVKESKPDLFVSIHQNSYPSPEVKGAQVFYYKESENGKRLAADIQKRLKQSAIADNNRSAKPNGSYYILKNNNIPSVIVECGFLSNPTENAALNTPEYRKKTAWAIYMGIMDYFSGSDV